MKTLLLIALVLLLLWSIGAGPSLLGVVVGFARFAVVVGVGVYVIHASHGKRLLTAAIGAVVVVGVVAPLALGLLRGLTGH